MADREITTSNTVLQLRDTYNLTAQDIGDIANLNSTTPVSPATDLVEAVSSLTTEASHLALVMALG